MRLSKILIEESKSGVVTQHKVLSNSGMGAQVKSTWNIVSQNE